MTLLEQIQRQVSKLPPERQSEVLDFVTFLRGRLEKPAKPARLALSKHPAFGIWKGREVDSIVYQQNLGCEWDQLNLKSSR